MRPGTALRVRIDWLRENPGEIPEHHCDSGLTHRAGEDLRAAERRAAHYFELWQRPPLSGVLPRAEADTGGLPQPPPRAR